MKRPPAVFAKNWGRYRNTNSYGVPLGATTAWGILGNVLLADKPLLNWRQQAGFSPAGRSLAWSPVTTKESFVKDTAIHPPIRWHRTQFKLRPHPARPSLRLCLRGLSYGAIWFNGHFAGLFNQHGTDASLGYYLPTAWLRDDNEIILLEESGKGPPEAELRHDKLGTYVPLRVQFE